MLGSLFDLVFRCPHRRLTRPMSPVTRAGEPHRQSYVVCLECGKQFEYDLQQMRIGKAIASTHDASIVPKPAPNRKLKVALFAAVPAIVLGAIWKSRKPKP